MDTVAFSMANGARSIELGYNRLAIVLTDGRAQDNVYNPASEAQNSGIQLYAVGVRFKGFECCLLSLRGLLQRTRVSFSRFVEHIKVAKPTVLPSMSSRMTL